MAAVSLGIMAYNEEKVIGTLLDTVLGEVLARDELREIFVVASGCTDRTEEIVRARMEKDRRLRLIIQERREGKASAINLFLAAATGDILVLESADTVPEKGALDKLLAPFRDPAVGMTGARPVPVNGRDTFVGFAVHLMWSLHHRISLDTPKMGELVAFRNILRSIPAETAVDEASIEAAISRAGLAIRYVPEAVVANKGPDNVRDFVRQRRRIAAGHRRLARQHRYRVSTSSPVRILRLMPGVHSWGPREILCTLTAVALETCSRALGFYDVHIRNRSHTVWEIATSTKDWD